VLAAGGAGFAFSRSPDQGCGVTAGASV
jgi:hypothetical protein